MPANVIPYFFGVALAGFIAALGHKFRHLAHLDGQVFLFIHKPLQGNLFLRFFRALWPLGTTPASILFCLGLSFWDWKAALKFALVLALAMVFEAVVKKSIKRQRPFASLPGVSMSQPRKPHDPSFPSGDTLRVWYLVLLLPFLFPLSVGVLLACYSIAVLISVGRMALGVHYPLDVLGGLSLGMLFAGIFLLF